MGIDVGFSTTRQTTGIACLDGDRLSLERAGTSWESREAKIPSGFNLPSSPSMDRCFRKAHSTVFAAMLNPFSFAPRSTIVADLDLVIMEWDWS
jgi:hypothetical protein